MLTYHRDIERKSCIGRFPVKSVGTAEYDAFLLLLRQTREEACVSQAALARELGRDQGSISRMESGQQRIDVVELLWILRVLGVAPEGFIHELDRLGNPTANPEDSPRADAARKPSP